MTRPLVLCALAVAACAPGPRPSQAGGPAVDPDEQRAVRAADVLEQEIRRGGSVRDDPSLELYLNEVASRLAPAEAIATLRFRPRILTDADPAARALPNGTTFVTTGLLARLESEGELAAILAHELEHVARHHAVRELKKSKEWTEEVGSARQATLAAFQRALELEADAAAVPRLRAAGYDVQDLVRMLERLQAFVTAAGLKEPSGKLATQPTLAERIAAGKRLAAASGATGGTSRAAAYAAEVGGLLLETARADLTSGRLALARGLVERRLAAAPSDAQASLLLGEIARRQGTAASLEAAAAAYRRALELDGALADAWRGLGLVLSKQGAQDGAKAAFQRYLELAPDAPDRAHVEAAIGGAR